MKVIKAIVSIILTLVAAFCMSGYIVLNATSKIIISEGKKGDTSSNTITSLDKDLFGIDVKKYKKYEKVDTVTPDMVHEVVDGALTKKGFPVKVVDYILKEDNYQEMYTEYKKEIFGYLKGEITKPNFPEDRLNGMIDRGLTKYNEENPNNKIDVEKAKLDFKNEVKVLLDKLSSKIETIKSVPGLGTLLKALTSNKLKLGLLIGMLVCIILLFIINKFTGGLIYTGVTSIIAGLITYASRVITKITQIDKVRDMLGNSLESFKVEVSNKGIILIVGGILIIVGAIILKLVIKSTKKDKDNKDKAKEKQDELEKQLSEGLDEKKSKK